MKTRKSNAHLDFLQGVARAQRTNNRGRAAARPRHRRGGRTLLYGGSNPGLMGALPHNTTPHLCAVKMQK